MPTPLHRDIDSSPEAFSVEEILNERTKPTLWQRYWTSLTGLTPHRNIASAVALITILMAGITAVSETAAHDSTISPPSSSTMHKPRSSKPSEYGTASDILHPESVTRRAASAQAQNPPVAPVFAETTGGATTTWSDYTDAGGNEGPTIPAYTTVQVSCRISGFAVADGNIWWYRIASSPWRNTFFASADAFYNNGATSGSLKGTPFYDPALPVC